MAPRETENNAYAKVGATKKEHYGMLWYFLEWSISSGGGGGIQQMFIRGGSAQRSNHLPFYRTFFSKKDGTTFVFLL